MSQINNQSKPHSHPPAPQDSHVLPLTGHQLTMLTDLLDALISHQRRQAAVAVQHRAAIRCANVQALAAAIAEQRALAEQLAVLQARRIHVTDSLCAGTTTAGANRSAVRTTASLRELVVRASEPARARLMALLDSLRAVVNANAESTAVLHHASRGMLMHISGVLDHVRRKVSASGTYSRRVADNSSGLVGLDVLT